MPIRPIIGPDNPVLRRKARALGNPNTPAVHQLIEDMILTLRDAPGVGLVRTEQRDPQAGVVATIELVAFEIGGTAKP